MKISRVLPGVLVVAAACGSDGGGTGPPSDNGGATETETVTVDGQTRSYVIFVPDGLPAENRPLLLAFHGHGSYASQMLAVTHLDLLADYMGMVVAFPDAIERSWTVQDTAFFNVLVDSLAVRHGTDPAGAFVLGFSQGGALAQVLACTMTGRVRSIMVHGMSLWPELAEVCSPSSPIPVFFLIGTADESAPWQESTDSFGGEGSARWWAATNGCEAEPTQETDDQAVRMNWTQCQGGVRVRLIGVFGGGHAFFFPWMERSTLTELSDWLEPIL